jgi:V/A-type H+-transporting ATPase subunit E
MGLKEIETRIITDARRTAEKLKQDAIADANRIIRDAEDKARELRSARRALAEREAIARKERILASVRPEARKYILNTKQYLIRAVIDGALQHIDKLDNNEYQKIIEAMFLTLDIPEGSNTVFISAKDKNRITPEFIARVERRLIAQGKQVKLCLADNFKPILGGFILKHGDLELNNSFDAILKLRKDEIEQEVVRILFGEK